MTVEIKANIKASFKSMLDVVQSQERVLHTVLMFDEITTKKQIQLDLHKDIFLGVCCEHGHWMSLEFLMAEDLEELFHSLDDGEVYYAVEVCLNLLCKYMADMCMCYLQATVGALGLLCKNNHIYPVCAILVSGDYKQEMGPKHSTVLQTTLDSVENTCENPEDDISIWIVSIASDGKKHQGAAMAQLTFKKELELESNIFPLLSGLTFMDMHIGDDDLTYDKDQKHLFKQLQNLLR